MRLSDLKLLVILLAFSNLSAQKQEIKSAFKELKEGYPKKALFLISDLDYKILNATDEEKSDFYYIRASCFFMLAQGNNEDKANLGFAVQAYNDLLVTENSTQLFKYSKIARTALADIKSKLVREASICFIEKKYDQSATKFYQVYQIDKNQLCYLYYSACSYSAGKDYGTALKYFTELKKINYSGKKFSYYATNAFTGKDEEFFSKEERDDALSAGTHVKLKMEMQEPIKENILKNIIVLNLLLNKAENAKKAILEYKFRELHNTLFDVAELKLYLETKDYEVFEKILLDRIQKRPGDADLYFYLGVINEKLNRKKEAKKYFKKVLEINPIYQFENDARLTAAMEAEKVFEI